ncbi:hypothetical protein Q4595_21955, partial [Wenyingzhuangia sp. 1_MG-2023]|nr:hypothetical protein [Wenyingzhuangia sp. 1_MG-2023]
VLHKLPLKRINWGRQLVISMPFVWLAVFFFVPFLVVFKISLSETAIAIPPYTALIELEDALLNIKLNLGNYLFLWEDSFYLEAYLSSIRIAGVSTLLALIIGFPMAYLIARSESRTRTI